MLPVGFSAVVPKASLIGMKGVQPPSSAVGSARIKNSRMLRSTAGWNGRSVPGEHGRRNHLGKTHNGRERGLGNRGPARDRPRPKMTDTKWLSVTGIEGGQPAWGL